MRKVYCRDTGDLRNIHLMHVHEGSWVTHRQSTRHNEGREKYASDACVLRLEAICCSVFLYWAEVGTELSTALRGCITDDRFQETLLQTGDLFRQVMQQARARLLPST